MTQNDNIFETKATIMTEKEFEIKDEEGNVIGLEVKPVTIKENAKGYLWIKDLQSITQCQTTFSEKGNINKKLIEITVEGREHIIKESFSNLVTKLEKLNKLNKEIGYGR